MPSARAWLGRGVASAFLVALSTIAASGASEAATSSTAAKRCPAGTTRALIGGRQTCLRPGMRCKRRLDRQYHRYGFHCHTGRLTRSKSAPAPRSVIIEFTGPPEVVFDWTADRCEDADIPDLPARAFRDAEGHVQLIATHYVNRRFIGADLAHLRRDCNVIMRSGLDADPAAFDDHEWLASTWTSDGKTVYALVHDEYQGNSHPGRCPSGEYFECWYNAITLAVSTDGGRSYTEHGPRKLVASVPYGYEPHGGPRGMFSPSNIVRKATGGYFYAFAWMELSNSVRGTCLMRTKTLANATSWRAWSGGLRFDTSFIDPYQSDPNPAAHLCKPVSGDPGSVSYNSVAHQWIGVTAGNGDDGGFYYELSPDLIHWTRTRLFYPGEVPWTYRCGDADPALYPSLIDPRSTSRNFQTSGRTAYLYYTQFHYENCQQTLDRDLVRVPVRIRAS